MTDGRQDAARGELTIFEAFFDSLALVRLRWRFFLFLLVVTALASTGVSLLLPNVYEARAVMLPTTRGTNSLLGQLGELPAVMGLDLAGVGNVDIYPAVALSDRILGAVAAMSYRDDLTYGQVLRGHAAGDSLQEQLAVMGLRNKLAVARSVRGGVVTLRYRHHNAYFAAALVNAVLDEMDRFYRLEMQREVGQQQAMIAGRLAEVDAELAAAEAALSDFRTANRSLVQSPALLQQEARLQRDVDIASRVFIELTRQQELVKIQQAGNTPALRILDRASIPFVRAAPQRSRIVVATTLAALICGYAWLVFARRRHGSA